MTRSGEELASIRGQPCRGWRQYCGRRVSWFLCWSYDGARAWPTEVFLCTNCAADAIEWVTRLEKERETRCELVVVELRPTSDDAGRPVSGPS